MGCICSKEFWAYKPLDHDHVRSKLVATRNASESASLLYLDSDFSSKHTREDLQLLPICETVSGIQDTNSNISLKLYNEQCLSYGTKKGVMLRAALGVFELKDKQISVRFEEKPMSEQEEILQYLYMNWQDLQQDSSVVEGLRDSRFGC